MISQFLADDIPKRIRVNDSSGCHYDWWGIEKWLFETSILTGIGANNERVPPDLEPDFQRGHVWTIYQQQAYIEYRLSGGYGSDLILFNEYPDMSVPIVIVDGLQRLTAVRRFMADELSVFHGLKGCKIGWRASQFDVRALRRNRQGASFRIVVNQLKTRGDVLRWYLELNSAGTPHAAEEIERVQRLYDEEHGRRP